MNVVIVNESLAYPLTGGNRIRTLNLMLRLAGRHQITYICRRGDPEQTRQMVAFLRENGIQSVVAGEPAPGKSGFSFYARLAANLFSPMPFPVVTHNCPAVRQAVVDHAASHRVDLWQVEWHPYLDAIPAGSAPRLLVAHDVISTIWQRHHQAESHPLKRWYIKRQWRKFLRYEGAVLRAADRVVAVSEHDARTLRDRYDLSAVDVVENGIDRAYFSAIGGERDPNRILFLGALDSLPNRDAAILLLDRIFPAVLSRVPSARLLLVGRNPAQDILRRAATMPQVEVCADVPDVRPHLGRAGVMAVPLRIGSGSRLKILEALAAGLPVVSTGIGAEGLALGAGREFLLADAEDAFAEALVHCLRHPEQARATADAGREVVLRQYDWDVLAEKLDDTWKRCAARARPVITTASK